MSEEKFDRLIRDLTNQDHVHAALETPEQFERWRSENRVSLAKLRKRLSTLVTATKLIPEVIKISKMGDARHFTVWCSEQSPASLRAIRTLLRGGNETLEEHKEEPTCREVGELIGAAMKNEALKSTLDFTSSTLDKIHNELTSSEAREAAEEALLGPTAVAVGNRQHEVQNFAHCAEHGNGEKCCAAFDDAKTVERCENFIEAQATEIAKHNPHDGKKLMSRKTLLSTVAVLTAAALLGGIASSFQGHPAPIPQPTPPSPTHSGPEHFNPYDLSHRTNFHIPRFQNITDHYY